MKKVTKEEFNEWAASYGKPLRGSMIRICEPPVYWIHDDSIETLHPIGSFERACATQVGQIDFTIEGEECSWEIVEQAGKEST